MRALLLLLLIAAVPGSAQVRAFAPVAPVPIGPRGAYMTQLRLQVRALTTSSLPLDQAFRATLLPAPAAATPEAFAARAALVEALAAPQSALPALTRAVQTTEGHKAEKAGDALAELVKAVRSAPETERTALASEAAALNTRFDGSTALPGESVDLDAIPTVEDGPGMTKARRLMKADRSELKGLSEMIAAGKVRGVLVVLHGLDTAGKDGLIKRPLALNPAWTRVAAFKKPTPEEAAQDFMVRIEKQFPVPGQIVIFNRSHYEDLVVPRVLGTHPKDVVEARYRRVLEAERKLAESGIVVIKIFTHVSKKEQRRRLQARIDRKHKRWKFSASDLDTRERFEDFKRVNGETLARTTPAWAPWHVVAADDKPRRDADVARLVLKTLRRMGLEWPARPELDGLRIPK
jgi:PPK2 family polyphosphate:nucleotide phosphotransferase